MTGAPSPSDVAAQLAGHVETLARELVGAEPTSRVGETIRFRRKGSLAVWIAGRRRGSWYDHEAGEGGDALALVAHLRNVPMRNAYRWALAWLGLSAAGQHRPAVPRPVAPPEPPREPSRTGDLARAIWREAVPASGTPAEAYLASRGLHLEDGSPLRFHPRAWRDRRFGPPGPAMVALMTDPATGEGCGAHVTYLRPDGCGKAEGKHAKIFLGNAGCIRLVPDAEVTLGLGIAEGIETALAVMQRTGWRPVWAASSAGAITSFPVLPGIEAVTIFADTGTTGIKAANACAARWMAAGREARILAPPRGDWDDVTREAA